MTKIGSPCRQADKFFPAPVGTAVKLTCKKKVNNNYEKGEFMYFLLKQHVHKHQAKLLLSLETSKTFNQNNLQSFLFSSS